MNEYEEKICDSLIAFVDFIYAVVFGLVVAQLFDDVIFDNTRSVADRSANVLLVLGVFYFLTWDWLHGRVLTLKNPYTRYRRFFLEILIAFCGYGAAVQAIGMSVGRLLVFMGLVLALGSLWAKFTLLEYQDSADKRELEACIVYPLLLFLGGVAGFNATVFILGNVHPFVENLLMVIAGWQFVLFYELAMERGTGLDSGPGVPFVPRAWINRLAMHLQRILRSK